jgi:hypothetical protein
MFRSVGSGRSLADTGHYFTHEGLNRIGRKRKGSTLGNDLDGLSGTVNNNPAGLALAQVLLKMCPEVATGGVVDVVPEFGQEVSAAKHRFSPGE